MALPTQASSTQTTRKKPREIKIGVPTTFTGDTYKYNEFKESLQLYLALNKEIYDTDSKKITFALGHFKSGTAALWRTKWLSEHLKTDNFGTYTEFIMDLDKIFLTQDGMDALGALDNLKQNGRRAADFVTEFRVYAYLAGVPSSRPGSISEGHLVNQFKRSLDDWLLRKEMLFGSGEAPKSLEWWYKRVVQLDENFRRSDLGGDIESHGGGNRELVLSCVKCGKAGHFASDCRSTNTSDVKPRNPKYKGKNYDPNYQPSSSRKSEMVGKSPKVPRLTISTDQY
ncbi:hypothetical protein BJ165DRAFT_1441212 [Panaeolus papilionaceus]|nr:hypothetical protein BJ165DRAFT_1441212 [Panaeolus papilionaceus]